MLNHPLELMKADYLLCVVGVLAFILFASCMAVFLLCWLRLIWEIITKDPK